MIPTNTWATIRILHAQGTPIRQIAKVVGVSRNTVKRHIHQEEHPRYQRTTQKESLVAPYIDAIRDGINKGRTGIAIFEEIKAHGYPGSYSTLSRYIRTRRFRPGYPS